MKEELDQISIAIRLIENEFDTQQNYDYDAEEQIIYFSEVAYMTLLTFLDKYNLIGLRIYVTARWEEYKNDLCKSFYSERGGGDFLAVTTNFLSPVLRALSNIYNIEKLEIVGEKRNFKLPDLLKLIPNTASKLGLNINTENALDKLVDAFLIPLYPDLNSNPALTLPEGYRQPDSSIPSLNLLIEYKFIKKAADLRNIIDEIQADIRNYAQEPWKYLYIIIGMKSRCSTEEKIQQTIFKEPSSFSRLFLSVINF